jgi:hypothetical protein
MRPQLKLPEPNRTQPQNIYIYIRILLRSQHGVKQCFHTMDVAVNNWATATTNPAGPISAKSTILMKNATIFVAKRTKNWAKNGAWQAHERSSPCCFFSLHSACLLLLQHD